MTNELSTTSILALFETSKEERQSFVNQTILAIKEGSASPLNVHLQLKCAEDLIKQLTDNKEYRELLLDEAQKHGKSFDYHNSKIEVREVGVKYDYSKCGDPVIADLKAKETDLKEKIKQREKFLQNLPEGGHNVVDEDSGEMMTLYRPAKSSTTSVTVSLK